MNVVELQEKSAYIVKKIGDINIINNNSFKDELKLYNIRIWVAAETTLALHIIPFLLSSRKKNGTNLFFSYFKIYFKFIINIFIQKELFLETKKHKSENSILFVSFTEYMRRDVFDPLENYIRNDANKFNINYTKFNFINKKNFKYLYYLFKNNNIINIKKYHSRQEYLTKKEFYFVINWLFYDFIPKFHNYLKLSDLYFKNYKPISLITIDNSDPRSRIFCLSAKTYNIPVCELQYGNVGKDSIEWNFFINDKLCVWGEYFKFFFISNFNIEHNKIELTGSPRFDYSLKNENIEIKKFDNINEINIIYISTYSIPAYDKINNKYDLINFKYDLISVMKKFKNINFYIKPHPLEDDKIFKNSNVNNDNIILLDKKINIINYLKESNAIISFGSTINYDVLNHNKIIISPIIPNVYWYKDYFAENNLSITFKSFTELENIFNNLLNKIDYYNSNDNEDINKLILKKEITSSEMITNVIKSIIK
jgi:CDP-glycerol glycerophosphotransferase (TagB/SpsB family)